MVVSNISPGSGGIPGLLRGGPSGLPEGRCCAMVIFDDWNKIQVGQRINVVCQSVLLDCNGKHLIRLVGNSELLVLYGELEPVSQLWSLLQVQVVEGKYKNALKLDGSSTIYPHEPTVVSSLTNCVELCCGAGFMSLGMKESGYSIIAGVEHNSKFGQLYHENDLGKFVQGSVGDADSIRQVLKEGGQNATVVAGVACQPYSRGGDGKGGNDERASTLPLSLEFAWLLQAPIVIVECAPQALHDEFVQSKIRTFCSKAGYHVTQTLLHLENCWAANRARWWCVLSAKIIGEIKFDDLPLMPEFQRVDAVMPFQMQWPKSHLEQLTLTLYEHSKFHHYSKGIPTMILDEKKQMPTALHAWGNQCYPCACGCRPGFSEQRMQQKGLFSVLIASEEFIEREGCRYPVCRHMHPAEVALMCGAFPNLNWHEQFRLGLAATGQMASPLQSCWVGSHVLETLAKMIQEECVSPEIKLRALQKHILSVRDTIWTPKNPPIVAVPIDGQSNETQVAYVQDVANNTSTPIVFREGTMVANLCQAENAILLGTHNIWICDHQGCKLPPELLLVPGTVYRICSGDLMDEACVEYENEKRELMELPLDFMGPPDDSHKTQGEFHGDSSKNDDDIMKGINHQLEPKNLPQNMIPNREQPHESIGEDPLCKVCIKGLLQMIPPQVVSEDALTGVLGQSISVEDRKIILQAQQFAWADDEMRYHLRYLAARSPPEQKIVIWDPIAVTSACKYRHPPCVSLADFKDQPVLTIITAVCIQQHWIPILWRKQHDTFLGFAANANPSQEKGLQTLHAMVCKEMGVTETPLQNRNIGKEGADMCGVLVLIYLEHLIWGVAMQLNDESIEAKHVVSRQMFQDSLIDDAQRPWIWGLGNQERDAQMIAILREHGVVADEVVSRLEMLTAKLGKDKLEKAVQSHNPWRELKWMANQHIPPIQIVKPSELQTAIDNRSAQQTPVGRKKSKTFAKGKGKGKTAEGLKTLDPTSLRLEEGIFVVDGKTPLSQVPLNAIGPNVQGVAMVTFNDALPFVSGGKAVTEGGLALIVVDMPDECPPLPLISAKVVFPAICAANSEPILIEGHMFQMGCKPVSKATGGEIVKLTSIDTCVAKFVIFRDQIQGNWEDVTHHPMKYLMHHVTILTPCQKSVCDGSCRQWHPLTGTTVKDPLLEVWNRQWMTIGYAHCSPAESELFAVTIRLPLAAESMIQSFSGQMGIFIEPKAVDGRQISEKYHVVWVPKTSMAQAMVLKQTIPGIVGLARIGMKLGARCAVEDSSRIHQAIKPDTQFLPGGAKQTYLVGPVPWGTLKQSLNDAFSSMGWEARALQATPAGRDVVGVMWRVQATKPPPEKIINLADGEAVITRVDVPPPQKNGSKVVLGSAASKQFVHKGNDKQDHKQNKVDRIFTEDPWAQYVPASPVVLPQKTVVTPDAWEGLEKKVLDKVLAQIPRDAMDIDDEMQANRVDALEAQVQMLQEQQQQIHLAVQDNHRTHQAQFGQLQNQFQAQHHRLEQVVNDQSNQIAGLSTSFSQQLDRQQGQLDQMFQSQMQKIEDLLSKKARHE